MDSIVQAIVNYSNLEVTWIKISNATKDSFIMSIDSKVTGTGPISATMAEMELDLVGPAGAFGKLKLPKVVTKVSGTDVEVRDQLIKITDMAAFTAFVKSLIQDESLLLKLENGKTTLKALFMKSDIIYTKEVQLKGMNGLKSTMVKTVVRDPATKSFVNTFRSENPSPVEIDLGTFIIDILNGDGAVIGQQRGRVSIQRGSTSYDLEGSLNVGVQASADSLSVVGKGVAEDNWNNTTVQFWKGPINATEEFKSLF